MPSPTSAGICEDDDGLRGDLRSALEREGYAVRATASGAEAIRSFAHDPPDVLVLDIGLPDADGRDVCQALRARGVLAPVLFLTARDALTDRLSGFHAGGDDYLSKPFALAELLVRVDALCRRARRDRAPAAETRPRPRPGRARDRPRRPEVPLTPTEFRLLAALAARPGQVVRRARARRRGLAGGGDRPRQHARRVPGPPAPQAPRRRRARAIRTARGVGYVFE